jgi:transposase
MALADSDGLPLAVFIESGSRHDVVLVESTLDAAFVDNLPEKLIGDKAFGSAALEQRLRDERDIELIAPQRSGGKKRRGTSKRKQDGRALRRYKRRWKVERLFAWLKQFRRLAVRWENKAQNYLGFLHLGCVVILLRQF